ncbi:MAG: hypothetical protein NT007_15340 [Candidatus Kapabacteria bacterium]|nr:hypothetical protein [Candidatus Kapabacteria bacterium]
MKKLYLFIYISFVFILINFPLLSQPKTWSDRGTGGGSAFYVPCFHPGFDNIFTVGCNKSQIFQTSDFGASFQTVSFTTLCGGTHSFVRFTKDVNIVYAIDYYGDYTTPVKSTDGGKTWSELNGNPYISIEPIFSLYVDYDNPGRIIMSSAYSIQYSSDFGDTFTDIYDASSFLSDIVVAGVFFDGIKIYIGTNEGLLYSANNGLNFAKILPIGIPTTQVMWSFSGARVGTTTRLFALTADPLDIYAGKSGSEYYNFSKGIYACDFPGNWANKAVGLDLSNNFFMFLDMSKTNINTVYIAGSNSSSAPTVFKTTNGGANWSSVFSTTSNKNIATGWCGSGGDKDWVYAECVFGFAVSPSNPNKVVVTDYGFVHTSTDGGTSWKDAYTAISDQNPQNVATPKGKAYHSNGLENSTSWQLVWSDAQNIVSAQSELTSTRSTDGGVTWSFNYTGNTANSTYRIINHPNGSLYAATSNVNGIYQSICLEDKYLDSTDLMGKVIVSSNKGSSWTDIHLFNHPVFWIAADPNNQNTMYASVIHKTIGGIYYTNDLQNGAASKWSKLTNPTRTEGHPGTITVLNSGELLVTYSGRLSSSTFTASSGCFLYNPANGLWSDVSDNGMKYWTKDVIVDPNDKSQNTWLACVFSGWGGKGDSLGGIYKTVNRGKNWVRINAQSRVESLTFNPSNSDEIYYTTEQDGLCISSNIHSANPTFSFINNYPFRQPERVFFNPFNPNEVWVTSYGGGLRIGTLDVAVAPAVPTLVSPADKSIDILSPVVLTWSNVANANSYNVQVSTNANFTGQLFSDQTGLSATSVTISALSAATVYYWRVSASNGAGTSQWSGVWSFTSKSNPVLQRPTLISPVNGSKIYSLKFSWQTDILATKYKIFIASSSDTATSLFSTDTITQGALSIPDILLSKKNNYIWKVSGYDGSKWTAWSDVWTFNFDITGIIDLYQNDDMKVQVMPNPVNKEFQIQISSRISEYISIKLLDINGSELALLMSGMINQGVNNIKINPHEIYNIPSGSYLILVEGKAATIASPIRIIR